MSSSLSIGSQQPRHGSLISSTLIGAVKVPSVSDLNNKYAKQEQNHEEKPISRYMVGLILHGHPDRATCLNKLGNFFLIRFERMGKLSDLEEAVSRHKDTVDLTPHTHSEKHTYLNDFGNSLVARFRQLGELRDLEEAILKHKTAVDLIPHGHPDKYFLLNNLGSTVRVRFEHLGDPRDLEEAVSRHREAVDLAPNGPYKPHCLGNLGNSLYSRFQCHGVLYDLEEALSRHKDAVDLTPEGHPYKPALLGNLGNSFVARFERLGELNDLKQAISSHRDAVRLTTDVHPEKPTHLSNLGNILCIRFKRLGELSDLEEAISRHKNAIDLTPYGHPNKPAYLSNLGTSFNVRFSRLAQLSDLEQAISYCRDAVALAPGGHSGITISLWNLGNCFYTRFKHLGELDDIEEAISRYRDAVTLTPDDHPNRAALFNALGNCFNSRFMHLGEPSDHEEAILRHRDAVDLTSDDHPNKPMYLAGLGDYFFIRFKSFGMLSDLKEAMSTWKDAVHLVPDGHPEKPHYLNNLGACFSARFERLSKRSDLEQAISLYSRAACASVAPVAARFRATQNWISSARHTCHHTLLHAYSVAISLLPQLAWIGHSLTHRCSALTQGADVVREAAAAALDSGFPELAVEWLEQGRSIVWGELFRLRSSYDELLSVYPAHAHKLRDLSVALEHAGTTREQFESAVYSSIESLQELVDRHRALAIERDKLLQEIRRLPGFERFLLYKDFSRLRASAHSGPVVILNAAETRCDALIVLADVDHVVHVPLPNFTYQRTAGFQNMVKSLLGYARVQRYSDLERVGKSATRGRASWKSLLSILWNGVVKPVLDALAFSTPVDLSRIFWCPTGPFVFLPIHAAGLYGTKYLQPGHKVYDFVISSYVPTLSILAPSPNPVGVLGGAFNFLVVPQPSSDGLPPLPGVETELRYIKAVIRNSPSTRTTLVESSLKTVEEVLTLMKEADWVHFACHGIQDGASPIDSGLCLADRCRLRISDIIALSRPRGGLAFLSACQTAMGDERLSEEAIHIAAGMLFAGYGGVVGTMWSISDKLAPRVAKEVYEQLFLNGTRPDYRKAAQALHRAIECIRDSGASFVEWLPFIHVGL